MTYVNLPQINFLATDAQELATEIITTYENEGGRKLAQADPLRLIFLSLASVITKQNVAINDAAKQNLLYYARRDVLDHKGAEFTTPRLESTAATTILRMHLSTPLSSARIIKKGELMAVAQTGDFYFVSTQDVIIEPNILSVDVDMECTTKGMTGNGFSPGQINELVKPLPYVSEVENITTSDGGADQEEDESYKSRVYLAPERLSTAGPSGAYEYYAKSASALISDVFVDSPEPGYVHISLLMSDGELPTEEIIDAVYQKCNARDVRPLTDFVTVGAPVVVNYNIDLTYYIEAEAIDKSLIHAAIEKAIDDFIVWQSSKIGRDINPSKLIAEIYRAGAKRVEIVSPEFVSINPGEVAQLSVKTVNFGGVEDD